MGDCAPYQEAMTMQNYLTVRLDIPTAAVPGLVAALQKARREVETIDTRCALSKLTQGVVNDECRRYRERLWKRVARAAAMEVDVADAMRDLRPRRKAVKKSVARDIVQVDAIEAMLRAGRNGA